VSGGQTNSSRNRSAPSGAGGRANQRPQNGAGRGTAGRGNQRPPVPPKGGGGRPAGRPPAGRSISPRGPQRSGLSSRTIAIGAVSLVVVVVVALIAVKVTGGSSSSSSSSGALHPPAVTTASVSVLKDMESVPTSVQDSVGAWSSVGISGLTSPSIETGQPMLHLGSSSLPAALYIGGEFCPYCAATRWALLLAFSKFGTFTGVDETTSSPWDSYPDTPTFTFVHAHYTSSYINFEPIEYLGQDTDGLDTHGILTPLTAAQQHVYSKYDTQEGVPFVDIANKEFVLGAPIDPQLLAGMTQGQVAAQLDNAKSQVTEAIVGTANDLIAGVCSVDGQQPGPVCSTGGVQAAAKALGIS